MEILIRYCYLLYPLKRDFPIIDNLTIYRPGYYYKKTDIILSHISSQEVLQQDLIGEVTWIERGTELSTKKNPGSS
jgi:hypothetical protein